MRALKDEGVKFIFGYPGGAALHIYDSIFKQKVCERLLYCVQQIGEFGTEFEMVKGKLQGENWYRGQSFLGPMPEGL